VIMKMVLKMRILEGQKGFLTSYASIIFQIRNISLKLISSLVR